MMRGGSNKEKDTQGERGSDKTLAVQIVAVTLEERKQTDASFGAATIAALSGFRAVLTQQKSLFYFWWETDAQYCGGEPESVQSSSRARWVSWTVPFKTSANQ